MSKYYAETIDYLNKANAAGYNSYDSVKAILELLIKDGYLSATKDYGKKKGTSSADGIWGERTQKAYDAWKLTNDAILKVLKNKDDILKPSNASYQSTYDYNNANDFKNLGFNNYNGLKSWVKSNPEHPFAKDMILRFGNIDLWTQNDIESALKVKGKYRSGYQGDLYDIRNSMNKWAKDFNLKNKEFLNKPFIKDFLKFPSFIENWFNSNKWQNSMNNLVKQFPYLIKHKLGGTILRFKQGGVLKYLDGNRMIYKGRDGVTYEAELRNNRWFYRKKGDTYGIWQRMPRNYTTRNGFKFYTEHPIYGLLANKAKSPVKSKQTSTKPVVDEKTELKRLHDNIIKRRQQGRDNLIYTLRADNTKELRTLSARLQEEAQYNNLSLKEAYNKARANGVDFFGYKGKVYKTDLNPELVTNSRKTALQSIYGAYLGYKKDPKLQTNASRKARALYQSEINGVGPSGPRERPTTNSAVNELADKYANSVTPDGALFIDLMYSAPMYAITAPITAALQLWENGTVDPYKTGAMLRFGFNPAGYAKDISQGNVMGLVSRGIDAAGWSLPAASGYIGKAPYAVTPTTSGIRANYNLDNDVVYKKQGGRLVSRNSIKRFKNKQ